MVLVNVLAVLVRFLLLSLPIVTPAMLSGKNVLVTGAGRGIGRAIAVICATHGASVAVCARTREDVQATADLLATPTLVSVCDVTDEESVRAMMKEIHDQWGSIDILINNAGGAQVRKGSFETLESQDLARLLNLNVVSVHLVASTALNHNLLSKGAKIINISSRAAKMGLADNSFYVASKFALEGLSATMAAELQDRGITVNTLSPGMVNTLSFPKPPDRPGVRTPEAVEDGLLVLFATQKTGHYLHVDELDLVRERGLADEVALKPINEPTFDP